jgi:hypothetical protein
MSEGKTLFQYYTLVRLLQQKQIVLLLSLDGQRLYLFYHDRVHTILTASLDDEDLPSPKKSTLKVFIWSLIDIQERDEPNWLLTRPPCLPVQTARLDSCRYKIWDKHRMPLCTGLPLWTHEELAQGYVLPISSFSPSSENTLPRLPYQEKYHSLLNAIRKVYTSTSLHRWDPLEAFPGIRALLEEGDVLPPSPEDALGYLLEVAIDHFGHSARDAFSGVFNFNATILCHERAFDVQYPDLQDAVITLPNNNGNADSSLSRHILALSPVYRGPLMGVTWTVNFKSNWIARCMVKKLAAADDAALQQQISFQNTRRAKAMLEWFGPLAHRCIAETSTGGSWSLINMISNDNDPSQFVVAQDASSHVAQGEVHRFFKVKREVVKFRSVADLSTYFENNKYYLPEMPVFPLLDAFTIDFNPSKKSAVLWVIHIATSRSDGGSVVGYQKICDIVASLKRQLSEGPPPKKTRKVAVGQSARASEPLVQVRYLVVVPEGRSPNLQWHLPKGWSENWIKNDNRGHVYCLEIPLSLPL